MKLYSKYNQIIIIATLTVLLLGSICYYYALRYVLIDQLDDTLKVEEQEIQDQAKKKGVLPERATYRDQSVDYSAATQPVKRHFHSRGQYDSTEHEYRRYRQLVFPVSLQGHYYTITVSKSQMETEDLLELIVFLTVGIILLLFLLLFLANRFLLRKLWRPFYDTLQSVKQFNLSSKQPIPDHDTKIDEFRDLDAAVKQMISKVVQDYETLRNFTDNASHEMQTPLAIINSKLDLIIQDRNLGEKQMTQLQAMYDAVGRLSKLNQSLLLLTKLENNQFADMDEVELHVLIRDKLTQFEDLAEAKHLQVQFEPVPVQLRMNHYLADILLNNLFSNAIRHNEEGGSVMIALTSQQLVIKNTGPALSFDPGEIFDRFKKNDYSEGAGLGLAIVKQICDNYNFNISYSYAHELHSFFILF